MRNSNDELDAILKELEAAEKDYQAKLERYGAKLEDKEKTKNK